MSDFRFMQTTPADSATPGSATNTPDSRSATFRAVEGGTEMRSGSVLLVQAYAAVWLILMIWLVSLWNKQRKLHARLDAVESALDRVAEKGKK